jgi:DNA-binding LytR/AlgR family response regulator
VNSIDYLLKPISKDDMKHALQKFDDNNGSLPLKDPDILKSLLSSINQNKRNRFLVKKANHYEFINAQDIAFIHSEDSLTFLYTNGGRRHIYSKTIAHIEHELDTDHFFQINRKQVVNINAVKKIHPYLNQRLKLDLQNDAGIEFIVSRNRSTEFKSWVDR